ncbi:MAG: efflux RND transporter periplasmic adaptor subunit, partial [Bacteroidia bacterium]|nr:efflux RND transporter periplasmic adaptor subunit [Bacteroidia bacterium]
MNNKSGYLYLLVLIIFGMNSCHNENGQTADTNIEEAFNNSIILTRTQMDSSGFKLGKLRTYTFTNSLKVNGDIYLPPNGQVNVSLHQGGKVGGMNLMPGSFVRKGQFLFSVTNPEFLEWQKEYLQNDIQLDMFKAEYDRQKILSDENISAKKLLKK